MEKRRKSISYIVIYIFFFITLNCYSQKEYNSGNQENRIEDVHLRFMLNYLVYNKYYDDIGIDYVYAHYKDSNQAFLNVTNLNTEEYGFYSYKFYSGEAHAAEFIMIVSARADNIVVLGRGDFNSNKIKMINFLKNNFQKNEVSNERLISIMVDKLKLIYPTADASTTLTPISKN